MKRARKRNEDKRTRAPGEVFHNFTLDSFTRQPKAARHSRDAAATSSQHTAENDAKVTDFLDLSGATIFPFSTRYAICCFGTLYHIGIRFRQDETVSLRQLSCIRESSDGTGFVVLRVVLLEGHAELHTDKGVSVAFLNCSTSGKLHAISNSCSLWIEALVSVSLLHSHGGSNGIVNAGFTTKICLNIYGRHYESHAVAADLAAEGLYLQNPEVVIEDVRYDNPQHLPLPEHAYIDDPAESQVTDAPASQINNDQSSQMTEMGNVNDDGLDFFESDFNVLVDRFAQHEYLSQASVDPRIVTDLLPHQRMGLDFLFKRESWSSQDLPVLWEPVDESHDDDPSQQVYQHRITGVKSSTRKDARGGILADDMGLGKSLVMICAVMASSMAALDYALKFSTLPENEREANIAAKSTLIIVPSAILVDGWIDEIEKHTELGTLSCYKYHGQNRHVPFSKLLSHDIVLTTYGTVAVEFKRKQSLLFNINWYRIVLDEAHMIRNPATIQFRSVSSLLGYTRWCLTGTPIQNCLDDLGSLVSFLEIPILQEAAQFRRHITRQTRITVKNSKPDFENLRLLLNSICLRRNKSILPFSQAVEEVCKVSFSSHERHGYRQLGYAWRDAIDMAISGHRTKQAHQTVLEALLRMRIFCNHTDYFGDAKNNLLAEPEIIGSMLQQEGKAVCHYCSCDVLSFGNAIDGSNGVVTQCHRAICGDCTARHKIELGATGSCPICHTSHASQQDQPDPDENMIDLRPQDYPSKVKALRNNIKHHRHESKSIVFSFWRKSLDIIGAALEEDQIPYLRVDGTLPFAQRKKVLLQFRNAEQGMVLLMTLGTGAVGLNNLSVANRVHIFEPQWNPSVEAQAIGRVLRLGQDQTVYVIRYIVENTVETNVQNGQLRKISLAKGGFGTGKATSLKHKALMLKDLLNPDFEA